MTGLLRRELLKYAAYGGPGAATSCARRRQPWAIRRCAALLISVLGTLTGQFAQAARQGNLSYALRSLSSNPDMVSGGDVFIEVNVSPRELHAVEISRNGSDVTAALHVGSSGRTLIGRIDGLRLGKNALELTVAGKRKAGLKLINRSRNGPIFSGPHQEPFFCETEAAGLGPATDKNCNAKTQVAYFYKSTKTENSGALGTTELLKQLSRTEHDCSADPCGLFRYLGFKDYDPTGPRPNDIAQTTTTEGSRLDFIVRRERGTINRAIYDIYFLNQPGQRLPNPWTRSPGWNGGLVFDFGSGCSGGYRQGKPTMPLLGMEAILGQGFALASSSMNADNCKNEVVSAETAMMIKEHFVKHFGVPVHTVGWGTGDGALTLYLVAQNYPGLLDGIIPLGSYPDILTAVNPASECALLERVFKTTSVLWTEEQKTAVSGFAFWTMCKSHIGWTGAVATPGLCNLPGSPGVVPAAMVFDRLKNPQGVRCNLFDEQINIWGRDPATGFARRPLDNVGVQYGLLAFNASAINAEQFLDLNERAGGFDDDGNISSARTVAKPEALRVAYQTGRVNRGGGGLASIPIIDVRAYSDRYPEDVLDRVRSFILRARLLTANGRTDNLVILTFPSLMTDAASVWAIDYFDPNSMMSSHLREILLQMDQWLDHIAKDAAIDTKPDKIARNKPDDLTDACWTDKGEKIADSQIADSQIAAEGARCHDLYPVHGDVRLAAGMPLAEDVLKCALKPLARDDYRQPLTDKEWSRLKKIFLQGVCDYSRPRMMPQAVSETWKVY